MAKSKHKIDFTVAKPMCDQSTLAIIMGRDRTTIRRWQNKGLQHVTGGQGKKNLYCIPDAIEWLVAYELELTGNDEFAEERLGKVKEERRRIRITNDREEKKLGSIEDFGILTREACVRLRQEMDGAAGKLSNGDPALRQRLLEGHRLILSNFVDHFQAYLTGPVD